MSDTRGPGDGPLSVLSAAAAALARSASLDVALETIVGTGADAVGASLAAVFVQDPDRAGLELLLARGMTDDVLAGFAASVTGDSDNPVHRAAMERQGSLGRSGVAADGSPMTAADLPLVVVRDGIEEPIGVLALGWAGAHDIDDAEAGLLAAVADMTAAAIDHFRVASLAAERAEWFERLAHTDPLTGLSNARTLNRVLELEVARAQRQGSEVSVAVFDIDGFAALNEAAGSRAGDQALREVAAVLAESVRLVDTIARVGADEFALVAPGSAGVTVARRVLEGISRLSSVEGHAVSVSAGVARFPVDGTDAESLLVAARGALELARGAAGSIGEAATEPSA